MKIEQYGYIIAFKVLPKLTPKERVKFFRKLYGYIDRSQYGKYLYRRDGLLTEGGYVQFTRGVFIVRKDLLRKVKSFLKGKAEVMVREVRLTEGDINILYVNRR